MANTVRGIRICEVCEQQYRPTYYEQRTCGRFCGSLLRGVRVSSPVRWRRCPDCAMEYTSPGRACRPCLATRQATPPVPPPVERECASCGIPFTPPNRRAWVTCSERCKRRAIRYRRKVREAGSYGEWRWSDFMRMASRFGYCCAYCGQKPDTLEPDHVRPLSRGGANVLANLLPACKPCNGQKTDRLLPEWTEYREQRGLPPLRTTWDVTDERYFHLTSTHPIKAAA